MIYVVDQNFMRSDELRELFRADFSCEFIIPDSAFEEMTKHEQWEATIARSFAAFGEALDRTFLAAGLGELLTYERNHRLPVGRAQLIPDDLTKGMRDLVRLVLTSGAGADELRHRILAAREAAAAERPANAVLKEEMSQSVRRLKELNGASVTRDIRNGKMSSSARLGLLKMRAEQLCREFLDFDIPDRAGPKIPDFLLTRFVYARLWYQEHWLDRGGLESAKGLANDEFDMEYALTASFFDALLSKDDRATKLAEDLLLLSRPQHEQHLLDALWDYSVSKGIVTPAN